MVIVALHGGFDAAQALLHGTGNSLVVVEVPWSEIRGQSGFVTEGKLGVLYFEL